MTAMQASNVAVTVFVWKNLSKITKKKKNAQKEQIDVRVLLNEGHWLPWLLVFSISAAYGTPRVCDFIPFSLLFLANEIWALLCVSWFWTNENSLTEFLKWISAAFSCQGKFLMWATWTICSNALLLL